MADHDDMILLSFDDGDGGSVAGVLQFVLQLLRGWIFRYTKFLRCGYGVASERSTHKNSAISHTGEKNTASERRGLTPNLFYGAKSTVRGG